MGVVYSLRSGAGWFGRRWRHLELFAPDGNFGVERCLLLTRSVVLFSLSSVLGFGESSLFCSALLLFICEFMILMWSVMFLVFWMVALLVGTLELAVDGDLLTVIERRILQRAVQSVRISQVKGHVDDDMVAVGGVRVEDKNGNDLADRAADFGRRRVCDLVMDVRWRFVSACSSWFLGAASFLCCYCSCCG